MVPCSRFRRFVQDSFLRILPEEAVLPIFWTPQIIGPMFDEEGADLPATRSYSSARHDKSRNKESSDMKRAMFSTLTVIVLAAFCGCITQHGRRPWACMGGSCAQAPENCQSCQASCENCTDSEQVVCRRLCRDRSCRRQEVNPGPPTGAITYPYYTTRGPRDFLAKDPPSIGP